MLALSPRFAEMWAAHEAGVRGPMLKRIHHPQAGPPEFECQVLHIAEAGQRLIAYRATVGSATEKAFTQLAAHTVHGQRAHPAARRDRGNLTGSEHVV
jgi:MmyB-like transcription regulator ligand binding domain